jgi:hypothetical protein
MAAMLPDTDQTRQARNKAQVTRRVAKSFATKVERLRGAKSDAPRSKRKTELVEAKLGMVRAAWLLRHVGIVGHFCWLDRVDRLQRDEID